MKVGDVVTLSADYKAWYEENVPLGVFFFDDEDMAGGFSIIAVYEDGASVRSLVTPEFVAVGVPTEFIIPAKSGETK